MVAPQEWCEVRANGGIFRDWTAVSVRYGVDPSFERFVQLELAEPMNKLTGIVTTTAQRLKPGDRVDVTLGGQAIILGGYVKIRQTAYDANRHAVQVVAVAKSNPIKEVSVDITDGGGQFRGYTFQAIAKKVLQPIGIDLQLINPTAAAQIPFRNVIVQTGETVGEFVERLARQRGLWLWTDVNGTIQAGNPAKQSGGATLAEGVNILAANSYIEFPWAESVISYSQTNGDNQIWGRKAAEIGAQSKLAGGDAGKKVIVLAEHPDTQADLQARTDFEAASLNAAIHRDVITHKGWFRPGTAGLWKEGDSAVVRSPMLYPFAGGEQTLRVFAVTCSQSNEGGTQTQVELVNEATFQQKFPDGTAGATPAKPVAT
jgi:prophage tail gpP-like protein